MPLCENIINTYQDFPDIPINRTAIAQERLDLVNRMRTSLFPWRGQFSPELVELLLTAFTTRDTVVLDPFVGSGTVLFECANRSLACFGVEINPAAIVMASTAHFVNVAPSRRTVCLADAESIINDHLPAQPYGGLFAPLDEPSDKVISLRDAVHAMLDEAAGNPLLSSLLANTLIRFSDDKTETTEAFRQAFREHGALIKRLPVSEKPCQVLHADARDIPLANGSVDVVLTSPPYINVFNYHQNYRPAMELMGWDLLHVAKSEFGSNRKHRGNRFLTVVQYSLDMLAALREMRRVLRRSGRIILVVGRRSTVRGVDFENGRIVTALAVAAGGLRLDMRQERKFRNKFGETIYEDVLHFTPVDASLPPDEKSAYVLAEYILETAAHEASGEVLEDLSRAKSDARRIYPSPIFRLSNDRGAIKLSTPHYDKLLAAIANPKCDDEDRILLREAEDAYRAWVTDMDALTSEGKERVVALVNLLNRYKDLLEVDLIAKRGSPFLRRQKGQLKLDNSVLEEFFPRLVHPSIIQGLGETRFLVGPHTAFASLSFRPRSFSDLDKRPDVVLKLKDQDFVLGARIHYRFAITREFRTPETSTGEFVLAVLAAELKVNLDKTMYQEAAGTAAALKMGCPIAKYFLVAEYLDMEPEDPRLTDIDNVLLLRHARRLPYEKRSEPSEVERHHMNYPIDSEVVWRFVEEIQGFVGATWYDPEAALKRGSFI